MTSPRMTRSEQLRQENMASPSYLEQFKTKAREWAQKVVELYNTPVPPALQGNKTALMKTAETIKKVVESVFGTIDEFSQIGLGILPLVPIAVVAGAITAIAKWTYDYNKFVRALAEQQRLENKGLSPEAASAVVSKKLNSSWLSVDWKAGIPIALIGGGLVLYYFDKRR